MNQVPSTITVICPKHGEHEYAIESTIPGHEGVWCQICWMESMGPSLPYRKEHLNPIQPDSTQGDLNPIQADRFLTMEEMIPVPEAGWIPMPKI